MDIQQKRQSQLRPRLHCFLVLPHYEVNMNTLRLYEQGADSGRIGQYVRKWLQWVPPPGARKEQVSDHTKDALLDSAHLTFKKSLIVDTLFRHNKMIGRNLFNNLG